MRTNITTYGGITGGRTQSTAMKEQRVQDYGHEPEHLTCCEQCQQITAYQIAMGNARLRAQVRYSYPDPTDHQQWMFSQANASDTALWQVY